MLCFKNTSHKKTATGNIVVRDDSLVPQLDEKLFAEVCLHVIYLIIVMVD